MPWNDPHTAAPNLWAWKQEENFQYECSVTESDLDYNERQVVEDFLLWTHRRETGRSTLCNYGRFHSSYKKSTNKKKEMRGYKLPQGEQNLSGLSSSPPLKNIGKPLEKKWMGLEWSKPFGESLLDISTMPNKPALYRILNERNDEIVYIGETLKLRSRWKGHLSSKRLINNSYCISFFLLNEKIPKHQLHELETDLVGNFYGFYKKPPKYQYSQTK